MKMKSSKSKIAVAAIISAVIIAVAGVILFSCLNSQNSNIVFHGSRANVVKQDSERRNSLVIGVSSAVPDIHPYYHNNDALHFFKKLVYEPLVFLNNDGTIDYLNADKIVFEKNGLEARISLNNKKEFSDGTGLTADIVIDSYNSFIGKDTAYNDLLNNIEYMQKIDEFTLVFKFRLIRISNMDIFSIPIVYNADGSEETSYLGTGMYSVQSITPDGDSVLERNENAVKKGKYENVILRHMDFSQINTLKETQDFDVFMFNRELQAEAVKQSDAYDIYEVGENNGWYLNYNIEDISIRNAVSSLASGRDFFEDTHDFGAYSKGITSAYMKKPNYHSLVKNGSFDGIESLTFLHNFEAEANAVYTALSKALEEQGVKCSDYVYEFADYPTVFDKDILIYHGKFTDMVNHADNERFFTNYPDMNAKDFNTNIEKYFASQNKITPLSKDTVWYASIAGKNNLDLFD